MFDVTAGGGLTDPLRHSPFTGLKYLADVDDGTWNHMLTPGASGPGMIVWSMAKSCATCGEYVPQWLLPGLCHWTSLSGPDGMLDPSVEIYTESTRIGRYPDTQLVPQPWGPMVGITSLIVPEEYECYHYSYTVSNNLAISEEDCDGINCAGDITAFGPVTGLVPAMSVIPISVEDWHSWRAGLATAWKTADTVLGMYGHCTCDAQFWEDDDADEPVCAVHAFERDLGTNQIYNDNDLREEYWRLEADCTCPYHSFDREWVNIVTELPTFVDLMPEDFGATWDYALDRYFAGWSWLHKHTPFAPDMATERNAWLTYYSRRFSPFLGPTGLLDYLQTHGIEQYAA